MEERELIYGYWGKAAQDECGGVHLLPYHCLDVAAVAALWWETSASIRRSFLVLNGHSHAEPQLRAWVLFFVALHDLGKGDADRTSIRMRSFV